MHCKFNFSNIIDIINQCFSIITIQVPPNRDNQDNSCELKIVENGLNITSTFDYRASLTPTITSSSPIRGGTGGGTLLTINGRGFP
jgi:hypothetical protein